MWINVVQMNLRFTGKRPNCLYYVDASEKENWFTVMLYFSSNKEVHNFHETDLRHCERIDEQVGSTNAMDSRDPHNFKRLFHMMPILPS